MIDLFAYPIFRRHVTALKETSIDNRDNRAAVYMTESERPAIYFDKVVEEYVSGLGLNRVPKSNDAILTNGNEKIVFVEFKNGRIDRPEQFAVRKKIYDSVLIFSDIVSAGISDMRLNTEYVLVYNETANAHNPDIAEGRKKYVQPSASFDSFAKGMGRLARDEYVCFGIKIFENYCFKKVHTYTQKEFEQYLAEFC